MPKILLSHIGNRNILYKGESHFAMVKQKKSTFDFRTFTKKLWENYETESKYIQPNIINTLLEEQKGEISRVILLASNHPKGMRNDQDTLFEGKILAKKLTELYPEIQFECRILKVPVTDTNLLLKAYRNALRKLKEEAPDQALIVCDAGGTAQQKSALKIMLEFLYDAEDYEVYYVAQGKDYQSRLQKVEPIEYRRIIEAEQMGSLIEHGYYQGALDIFSRLNRSAQRQPIWYLLKFAHFRSERLTGDARRFADSTHYNPRQYAQWPFLERYYRGEPIGQNVAWALKLVSKADYFDLCEILTLVQFQLALKDYTQVVMHLSRFIENYLRYILTHQFACPYPVSNGKGNRKLLEIAEKLPNVRAHWNDRKKIMASLPTEILVCENLKDPQHGKLIRHMRSLNGSLNPVFRRKGKRSGPPYALNSIRNRIAHAGLGVSEATFTAIPGAVNFIMEASEILAMPMENIYTQMNEFLLDEMI